MADSPPEARHSVRRGSLTSSLLLWTRRHASGMKHARTRTRRGSHMRSLAAALLLASTTALVAQDKPAPPKATTAAEAPMRDTSYIDENGTAHVTRIVPIPEDLSPEAKA